MQVRLQELADLVGGRLVGDGETPICEAATLACAEAGQITLVDRPEKLKHLFASAASAAVVPLDLSVDALPVIQVADVHAAFAKIVARFRPPRTSPRVGISPLAHVSPKARLGSNVDVHPFATIGDDVEIGDGSTIHSGAHVMAGSKLGPHVTVFPGAVLYENTRVGARSTIHASVVLGAHGFGYAHVDGHYKLGAQLGHVEIGEDVDIGAGTTIDRGTYGATVIGEGTKIDNLVQIGHNCRIGRHNMLCAQVGIAGSTTTGDYVVMGGQAGVRDHVHIGERAHLSAMAGVINDVPANMAVAGIPSSPLREQLQKLAAISRLPETRQTVKRLAAEVERLSARLESLDVSRHSSPGEQSEAA